MIICLDCNQPVDKPIIKHIRDKHQATHQLYLQSNRQARGIKARWENQKQLDKDWIKDEVLR